MREMKTVQRKFFDQVQALEPMVDAAGAECGLHALDAQSFEEATRAEIKRIANEIVLCPPIQVLVERAERLSNDKAALEAKTRQTLDTWRSAGALSSGSEHLRWRRMFICSLVATLLGLLLRLGDMGQRWETFALLGVAAVLLGLGPWRVLPRIKAGSAELGELVGYIADRLRSGWIGARLGWQQAAIRKVELQMATVDQWQQVGSDVLMSRFRTQYHRGELAAKLSNES